MTVQMALMQTNTGLKCDPQKIFNHPSTFNLQELSKPRLATPLHAYVLVTYLLSYLGTYLFTRLLTRYVLQPLLYKLSKIVLI